MSVCPAACSLHAVIFCQVPQNLNVLSYTLPFAINVAVPILARKLFSPPKFRGCAGACLKVLDHETGNRLKPSDPSKAAGTSCIVAESLSRTATLATWSIRNRDSKIAPWNPDPTRVRRGAHSQGISWGYGYGWQSPDYPKKTELHLPQHYKT